MTQGTTNKGSASQATADDTRRGTGLRDEIVTLRRMLVDSDDEHPRLGNAVRRFRNCSHGHDTTVLLGLEVKLRTGCEVAENAIGRRPRLT